jgi:hypothetical protein
MLLAWLLLPGGGLGGFPRVAGLRAIESFGDTGFLGPKTPLPRFSGQAPSLLDPALQALLILRLSRSSASQ